MTHFFVSYNNADEKWAEWIAWHLEEAGYKVVIQAWDFEAGQNFVQNMHDAAERSERTIAVLSPDYLSSQYTQPEWQAAFKKDPTGNKGLLVPVRIRQCELPGLLAQVTYIDLVGLSDGDARDRLLTRVETGRKKPLKPPRFPDEVIHSVPEPVSSPATTSPPVASSLILLSAGSKFRFLHAIEIKARQSITIQIVPQNEEDVAFLDDLQHQEPLAVAYGTKAFLSQLHDVSQDWKPEKDIWTVTVTPVQTDYGAGTAEPAYQALDKKRYSADDIAEKRARLILFNERPNSDDPLFGALLQGINNPLRLKESPLPAVYDMFENDRERFIAAARLMAVLALRLSGVLEHVLKLQFTFTSQRQLHVDLVGRRRRKLRNQDPHLMTLQGDCRLEYRRT